MNVIIMRGVPGSGKSTMAKRICEDRQWRNAHIVSADHFFMDTTDGTYRFNPEQIGLAHNSCFLRFLDNVQEREEAVIVDNTNTRLWECAPYVLAAQSHGYEVELIHLRANTPDDVVKMSERCIHGVPKQVCLDMYDRFERALPHWKETTEVVSLYEPPPSEPMRYT